MELENRVRFPRWHITDGKPLFFHNTGSPVVEIEDQVKVMVVENIDPRFKEKSDALRKSLAKDMKNGKNISNVRVRIVSGPPRTRGYVGVMVDEENDFSKEIARSVICGERIFYGMGIQRTSKTSYTGETHWIQSIPIMRGYNSKGKSIEDYLHSVRDIRPKWESNIDPKLIEIEKLYSTDMIQGSKRFSYERFKVGEFMLIRQLDDGFEPVITFREGDEAINPETCERLVTCVTDKKGNIKSSNYKFEDIVRDIPIITTMQTEKLGEVGIGYVRRPVEEFNDPRVANPTYLKKVWVKNADRLKRKFVREAEILYNGSVIIADF